MAKISFEQQVYESEPEESVLDCLLRHALEIPSSCRSGICQTCMMRSVDGAPTAASQQGLKPALIEQDYFLTCSCVPEHDMAVVLPNKAAFQVNTTVKGIIKFTEEVVQLSLARPEGFEYSAGQFLTIYHPDGQGRSYSLASVPGEDEDLQFHIHTFPDGHLSRWIADELQPGDSVAVSEAIGGCVYASTSLDQPILMIATGTGLAPVYGVLKDALHRGHRGEIKLYHGSRAQDGLYMADELRRLAQQHPNVTCVLCLSGDDVPDGFESGRANDVALSQNPVLTDWVVYLCGMPEMVNAAKRAAFLAGASMRDIYSDPFVHN